MQRLRSALYRNPEIFCKGNVNKTGENFPECGESVLTLMVPDFNLFIKFPVFLLTVLTFENVLAL